MRIDTDATRAFDNRTGREVPVTQPIELAGREVDLFLLDHHPRQTILHRPGLPGVRIGFGDDQSAPRRLDAPGPRLRLRRAVADEARRAGRRGRAADRARGHGVHDAHALARSLKRVLISRERRA